MKFTDEQWSAWWDGFRESREGWAYLEGDRQFAVAVRPDGTFRIEDVPSGRYVLKFAFRGSVGDDSLGRHGVRAGPTWRSRRSPGGRSDEPLDVGTIMLEAFPFRELNVGEPASQRSSPRPLMAASSTWQHCAESSRSWSSGRPDGPGPACLTSKRRTTPSAATRAS